MHDEKQSNKFRVFLRGKIEGPYPVIDLCKLVDFSLNALVCPEGEDVWIAAEKFPDISKTMAQVLSGDYKPEPLPAGANGPEESQSVSKVSWREAVIGNNIPDYKLYTASDNGFTNLGDRSDSSGTKLKAFTNAASKLGRRRKVWLILLGFVSFGAYFPRAENFAEFLLALNNDDIAILTMGSRFRQGAPPHTRTPRKREALQSKDIPNGKTAPSVSPSHASNVEEIGSEDLGNGLILKTVVITEIRNGVRTQRTTTMEVQAHPRKTHKSTNKNSRADRLFTNLSHKIA
jgi:hypothetical protein